MRALMVALLVALAGCSDGGSSPKAADDHAQHDETMHIMHLASILQEPYAIQESFDEVFSFADTDQASAYREIDVSHLLPDGPSFVTVEIVPNDSAVAVSLVPDDFGQLWTFEQDGNRIETSVSPGGLKIGLQYGGPFNTNVQAYPNYVQGETHTVTVTVVGGPGMMPSGMAMEVELPSPGSHVVFTGDGGNVPDVLVWGPDDTFLGNLNGGPTVKTTLQENGTAGKFVFLPKGHGNFYTLEVGTTTEPDTYQPKVRVLDQRIEQSDVEFLATSVGGFDSFTMAASSAPIQVGACAYTEQGLAQNAQVSIKTPDGTDVASGSITGFPDAGTCGFTEMGDDRLTAGEYTIEYDAQMTTGLDVQGYLIHYAR